MKSGKSKKSELPRAWEIYLYAEQLHAQRMNYGTIIQSLWLIAYAIVFSADLKLGAGRIFFLLALAAMGLFYSYYQYSRLNSVSVRMHALQKEYFLRFDPVFVRYMGFYSSEKHKFRVRGEDVAALLGIFWLVLLLSTFMQA